MHINDAWQDKCLHAVIILQALFERAVRNYLVWHRAAILDRNGNTKSDTEPPNNIEYLL